MFERRLRLLLAEYAEDATILLLLSKIAGAKHTTEDIDKLSALLLTLFRRSAATGYLAQSEMVRMPATKAGLATALELASRRVPGIVDRVEATLSSTPQLLNVVSDVTVDGGVRQGFGTGQKVSAEENELLFKKFIRVGDPATGERRPHSILEGQIIPANKKFRLPSGELIEAAHDWQSISNPAAEWINCHHATIYLPSAYAKDISPGY
jgi:hypothetical protein